MKTLSIIVPVYNCGAYLESCVQGLLTLDRVDCEILLIDDGSTDGSGRLCDEIAGRWSCVRCIHQQNGGVSSARNRGIEEAEGTLILFVDSDDSIEPEALLPLIDRMQEEPAPDLLAFGMYFDYYRKGSNYRTERVALSQPIQLEREQLAAQIPALFQANYLSPVWNKLLRRSILMESGIRFDPKLFLLEDLDFSLRYLACCHRVLCAEEAVYHYRQAEDEGNAGRRLLRVERISAVMEPLRRSFETLAASLQVPGDTYTPILTDIYLMLAQEKISVSDRSEIRGICDDFASWTRERSVPADKLSGRFPRWLLEGRVNRIIARRAYSRLRHWVGTRLRYAKHLLRQTRSAE